MTEKLKVPPQALIIWGDQGIEIKLYEGAEAIPLTQIEKAGFLLHTEVLKSRARLSHKKPSPRTAGWDNSHEPSSRSSTKQQEAS